MWGRSKPPSKVQILVDLAREVFDGVNIPSDPDIMRVKAALSAFLSAKLCCVWYGVCFCVTNYSRFLRIHSKICTEL